MFWIRILLSSIKNSKKNLDSYFLSLKNDANVPSKSNKQKIFFFLISFLLVSWRSMTKIANTDPLVRGVDPDPKCHGSGNTVFNYDWFPPMRVTSSMTRFMTALTVRGSRVASQSRASTDLRSISDRSPASTSTYLPHRLSSVSSSERGKKPSARLEEAGRVTDP